MSCEVRYNEFGRGIYTTKNFKVGETVILNPLLRAFDADTKHLLKTSMYRYAFEWHDGTLSFALGLGALLNHSEEANVEQSFIGEDGIIFKAIKAIKQGSEITLDYEGTPDLAFQPGSRPYPANEPDFVFSEQQIFPRPVKDQL